MTRCTVDWMVKHIVDQGLRRSNEQIDTLLEYSLRMEDESVIQRLPHRVISSCGQMLPHLVPLFGLSARGMRHTRFYIEVKSSKVAVHPLRPAASHIWRAQESQSTAWLTS